MPNPSPTHTWPAQTPYAAAAARPRSLKRKRQNNIANLSDVEEAQHQCQLLSGNDRQSCWPTRNTTINQGQYASFVWNSRRPELTQDNRVNVYLFHGDTMRQILSFEDLENDPLQYGVIRTPVNDSWWGDRGDRFSGSATTYPFYWVVTPTTQGLDGSQQTQAIFNAIQTTYPDSMMASMSSASASASSASASASSASAAATQTSITPNGGTGDVRGASNDSFPQWAIAVIVVLGFLALAALGILAFIILRRARRRDAFDSNRNSMGSSSPMMAHADGAGTAASPLLAGAALGAGSSSHGHDKMEDRGRAPSVVANDAESTISRANSTGDGPFSGADAAIMADAFRKALRKPDFAGRPVEEGESPEHPEGKEELLNRELAEEGRDIRSVASSKGVRVVESDESQK